jgi:hypothetical protein
MFSKEDAKKYALENPNKLQFNRFTEHGAYYMCMLDGSVYFSEHRTCQVNCPKCHSRNYIIVKTGRLFLV